MATERSHDASTSAAERAQYAPADGAGVPTADRTWLADAMLAWDDTRRALMAFDRDVSSVNPNLRETPQKIRRALDRLRRADRTRPRWVEEPSVLGLELGDEPRDPAWTERQLAQTRAAARRLHAELEATQTALREARRSAGPSGPYEEAAQAAESAITAILRPLSLSIATTTAPAQRAAAQGIGAGLVLGLGALFLFFR